MNKKIKCLISPWRNWSNEENKNFEYFYVFLSHIIIDIYV